MQRFGDGGSVQEQAPSVTAVGHWVPSLGLPVPSSEGKIFWTHIMQQCTARSWPQEGDLEKFSGGPPDKRARGGNAAESGAPYPGHLQHLVSPRWWRGLPCASHAVPRCPSPLYSRDNLRGARVRRQRVSYPRRRRCRPYGTRPWARQSDRSGCFFFLLYIHTSIYKPRDTVFQTLSLASSFCWKERVRVSNLPQVNFP